MYNQDECTLVVINWNNRIVTELCLKSYVSQHYKGQPLKLKLVDNGSHDDSKEWLRENGVPFYDFQMNLGHENAINCMYNEVHTPVMLLVDSDVEFIENVITKYLPLINDETKLIGDYITGDKLNDPIKPRCGAWFMLTDIQAMKDAGVTVFRDKSDWSYDVGSQYTEAVLHAGFKIHHTPKYPGNIDRDPIGMNYGSHFHYGKLSWNLDNHGDREQEVNMRMNYIQRERLPLYKHVELKNKFV